LRDIEARIPDFLYVAYTENTLKDQTGMDRKIVGNTHKNRGEATAIKTL